MPASPGSCPAAVTSSIQEPMAGPTQPPIFPLMWARDATTSFLRPPAEMRALIEAAGFRALAWEDVTAELAGPSTGAAVPAHSIARIVMGDGIDDITRRRPAQPRRGPHRQYPGRLRAAVIR